MTAHAAERAAHKSGTSKLDEVTTQAVLEVQKALRAVRLLERDGRLLMSTERRREHHERLLRSRSVLRDARAGLDRLLEDDA